MVGEGGGGLVISATCMRLKEGCCCSRPIGIVADTCHCYLQSVCCFGKAELSWCYWRCAQAAVSRPFLVDWQNTYPGPSVRAFALPVSQRYYMWITWSQFLWTYGVPMDVWCIVSKRKGPVLPIAMLKRRQVTSATFGGDGGTWDKLKCPIHYRKAALYIFK